MSMNISQADLQQLQQMFQGASNIPWSTILGYVNDNGQNPPQGTNTLAAEEATGILNPTPGSLTGDPTINQEALLGEATQPSMATRTDGSVAGGLANQSIVQFANANDVPVSWVQAFATRFGTMPTNQATLGQFMLQLSPADAQRSGINVGPSTTALANTYTSTDPFASVNVNGVKVGPGSQYNPFQATLAAQAQYGNSGGAAGGGSLTLAAKKQYMDAILNAPKGPADAFSYLAKEQSMANPYNPVAQLLGNNVQAVTGQSLSSLSNTPTLTNTQLAGDLVNSQNGGSLSPLTSQFLSRSLQPTAYAGWGAGGVDNNAQDPSRSGGPGGGMGATIYGGTHFHSPSGFQTTTGLPTGFQTSLQAYNKLEPEAQAGFLDLQQAAGGQTPTDFNAGLRQGAPEFGKAATGNLAASAL